MIRLDQHPGDYYLRFTTYPNGDPMMQQVLEGQAIVSYNVSDPPLSRKWYESNIEFLDRKND